MTGFIETTPNRHSVMEPGSSGSPLINSQKKLIGQLFGPGNTTLCPEHLCGNNPGLQRVSYGKFSISWTGNGALDSRRRLQDWLDPNGSNPQILDGNGIPTISGPSQVCDQGTYTVNIPAVDTLAWSAIPLNIVTIQQNGNSATLTRVGNGKITLSATINNSYSITKSNIQVGTAVPEFNLYRGTSGVSYGVVGVNYTFKAYGSDASTNDTDYYWTSPNAENEFPLEFGGRTFDFMASTPGDYTVSLSYNGTCGWSDPITKVFNFRESGLAFTLSPNPSSSTTTISITSPANARASTLLSASENLSFSTTSYIVKVIDAYGSIAYIGTKQEKQFKIPTSSFRNGVYTVIVSDGTNIYQNKLIVKH